MFLVKVTSGHCGIVCHELTFLMTPLNQQVAQNVRLWPTDLIPKQTILWQELMAKHFEISAVHSKTQDIVLEGLQWCVKLTHGLNVSVYRLHQKHCSAEAVRKGHYP